ncbi:WGR domain-containing protein [Aureispira sp. CCB-E]|uniref:WGR domain-containing protein n=1 Tax=Aureispira sp. CCB-E TaxID=3051121 RepID=UPI00286905A6|nr:WGR domain-containing protein [Aureispira sp. CCB-E]WMX13135.1 WGR domain-containing protein [Aureispira sp. CCB-E]
MRRKLINQTGTSNKFWNIKVEEETQIINWGKIGTKGRESVKRFLSSEECLKESKKLITQKFKKGYSEILLKESILKENEIWNEENAEHFFWEIIEKSNRSISSHWSDYHVDDHLENLTILLSKFEKKHIVLFQKCIREKLNELYIGNTAELYIILNCSYKKVNGEITFDDYISTDGYIYFRCWLLLKGKAFFDDIKKDINSFINGKYSFNIGNCWAEGLLYVCDYAYAYSFYHENLNNFEISTETSKNYPEAIHYDDNGRNKMDREFYGGRDLQELYPHLVKSMCELRNE